MKFPLSRNRFDSSGLKLRECFVVDSLDDINLPKYEKPPLTAPFWFKCFNAERITKDLEDGKASAFLFKKEEFDGIDNVIAVYPDGRSYRWRQLLIYERLELSDFILELISEEIPAKMQVPAMRQLEALTLKKVGENGILVKKMLPFVTPIRLGIILENISIEVKESVKEIRGPRLGAPENA